MKSTGYKVASSLLAAALVLTPSVPVFAAGTAGTGQVKGLPNHVVSKGKQVTRIKANSPIPQAKVQTIHGTVSPLVTSGKAKRVSALDPNRVMHLGFVLQPRNVAKMTAFATSGQKMSAQQYKSEFAPTSTSIATVKNFLTSSKLNVETQTDDMLLVSGTAAQFEKVLKIQFNNYQAKNFKFFGTASDPVLPTEVASTIKGVLGLNETPYSKAPLKKNVDVGANGLFTPDAVRTAYGMMPAYANNIDGRGRNIAILMQGDFYDNDVKKFSETFGIPYNPDKIIHRYIQDTPMGLPADGESTLDVEWAHALAPGATITEYETGTLDDMYLYMGLDTIIAASPTVDVINMSFGAPEKLLSPNQLDTWHTKFVEAVAKGITPIASSGDYGAYFQTWDQPTVQSPASDPFVLAVGGTSLQIDPQNNRTDETTWGEADLSSWIPGYTLGTGGGYSTVFSDFTGGTSQKRGVPDVSMLGQNIEMYDDYGFGGFMPASGTSFSAPMWSGIIALAAQKANHGFGWIRPAIQSIAKDPKTANVFHDITAGNNGVYQAETGWDAVTGWGSPENGWSLVQALATQKMNRPAPSTSISGLVVGDASYSYDQTIVNGVGTVDLIGSGFGNNGGTATLTDEHGVSYTVPFYAWTDADITLNIDSDRFGLFSLPNHPVKAGTYTLKVKTASGKVSNTMTVKLGDFVYVEHSGIGTVSSKDHPAYQDVQITVMGPDGTPDESVTNQAAEFYIVPNQEFDPYDPQAFSVQQNGQPIPQNLDGGFTIQIGNNSTIQVASTMASDFRYVVFVPDTGVWGGDGNPASFMTSDGEASQLVSLPSARDMLASVGSTNTFDIALQDPYGNILSEQDQLEVTIKQTTDDITGEVTVDDNAVSLGGEHYDENMNNGYATFNVSESNISDAKSEETFAVVVTDLDKADPNHPGQNLQVEVPVTFTKAATLNIVPDSEDDVPVTVPGSDPNWKTFTLNVLDRSETNNIPFHGKSYMEVDQEIIDYYNYTPVTFRVQANINGVWQDLSPESDGMYQGQYALDLSQGTLQIRVASPVAGQVIINPYLCLNYSENAFYTATYTAGAPAILKSFVNLPHMATSPADAPQYAPVSIMMTDAVDNYVTADDTLTLTEAAGGPAVKVALMDDLGAMTEITPDENGVWSFNFSALGNNQIYIASAAPGIASFTLADSTTPAVQTSDFQISFVNSTTSTLHLQPIDSVLPGNVQTVEADFQDAYGQQVVSFTDPIALTIGSHRGKLVVTDADNKPIQPDKQGKYIVNARAGVALFHVTDPMSEALSYSLADLYVPKLRTTTRGTFSLPTKFEISAISKETLPIDTSVPLTVTAEDLNGKPLAHSTIYLSFNQASGGGQAIVHKKEQDQTQDVSLGSDVRAFVTDEHGQITLTYTTPHYLPNGGVDTIKVQDAESKPKGTATSTYTFAAAKNLVMSPATIADTASLKVKEEHPVSMTALDSNGKAMPYTGVYLWLDGTPNGGHAFVGTDKTALTSTPTLYYTDENGKIALLYDTPDSLPSGGTDTIIAQDLFDHPHVKGTSAYTYASTTYYVFNDKQIEVSGKLPADGKKEITVMAQDKNKKPLGNTTLYLSLSQALNGGSATVGGKALTDKPQPFVTDKDTGLVTITYKAPAQLPAGGIDTIVAQNTPDTKPKLKASNSYTFAAVNGFTFDDGKVIAANGSLKGGDTAPVTVTVLDSKQQPMANTLVYLSLSQTEHGGSVVVKETDGETETQTPVTADSKMFATDAAGHIQLLYTAPAHLPGGGVDTITVQDAPKNPHAKLTDTYTFTPIGSIKPVLSNTIAQPGLLKPQTVTHVQAVALDAAGKPMANTYVYVTFAGGVGTVSVDGNNVSDKAAYAAVTDPNGVVDITYTTPAVLPTGKSITIVAGDKSSKSAKSVSFTYTYPKIGAIKGVTTFATKGSMQASGKAEPLIVTVVDTTHHALANVGLELTFTSTGQGGTLNVNGAPVNGKTIVSTNDQGQLVLDYQAAESLTSGVKDTLVIKDPVTGKTLTVTYTY